MSFLGNGKVCRLFNKKEKQHQSKRISYIATTLVFPNCYKSFPSCKRFQRNNHLEFITGWMAQPIVVRHIAIGLVAWGLIPDRSNPTQCYQRLATAAMFLRS